MSRIEDGSGGHESPIMVTYNVRGEKGLRWRTEYPSRARTRPLLSPILKRRGVLPLSSPHTIQSINTMTINVGIK